MRKGLRHLLLCPHLDSELNALMNIAVASLQKSKERHTPSWATPAQNEASHYPSCSSLEQAEAAMDAGHGYSL